MSLGLATICNVGSKSAAYYLAYSIVPMKSAFATLFVLMLLAGCGEEASTKIENKVDANGRLIEGVSVNYHPNGKVQNEVPVKNGKRHGEAKEYYESGVLAASIEYEADIKNGWSRWYYQDGVLYQEAQYVANKKSGIEKKYHNTGELMAVLKWKDGEALPGLKEYQPDGREVKQPAIRGQIKGNQLEVRLSNGSTQVQFYEGLLGDDEILDPAKHPVLETVDGVARLPWKGQPVHIIASRKSNFKNPQLLQYTHNP